jgi:hypothetical protein
MAFRRSRRATVLLAIAMLGGAGAQVSGTHPPAGQAPRTAVLGATEVAARADADLDAAWSGRSPRLAATAPATALSLVAPPVADPSPPPAPPPPAPPPAAPLAPPASSAPPTPSVGDGATGEDLAARTLAEIRYPWRAALPGWRLVFQTGRSGVRGMTFPAEKRIEIYVRDRDTAGSLARVVAHELGHAIDVQHNDARDRARWRAARGVDGTVPWWPGDGAEDLATLAGDFAEAFVVWQLGLPGRSVVAGELTDEQLAVLASLVP